MFKPITSESLSKTDKAALTQVIEQAQDKAKLNPALSDILEASQGTTVATEQVDFVQNPLAANPPERVQALPPNSEKHIYTLFDAIAALGPMMLANSAVNNNDVEMISAESNRIIQLGLQLTAFQDAQKGIENAIKKEQHADKKAHLIEQIVFGASAVLFAAMIAGPAGAVAALMTTVANDSLQDTHTYQKMTKNMTPTQALFTKLGTSVAIGVVAGVGTGVALTATSTLTDTEAESIAQNLGTRTTGTAARTLVEGGTNEESSAEMSVTNQEPDEAVNISTSTARSAVRDEEEGELAQVKKGDGVGNVKTKGPRLKTRAAWIGFDSFKTMATGFSSKSKGEKGSYDLFGDLAVACGGNQKAAGWVQMGFTVALTLIELGLGGWVMRSEAPESTQAVTQRLINNIGSYGQMLSSVAELGTSTYQAISAFTQMEQNLELAGLVHVTGELEKNQQEGRALQSMFTNLLQSSTSTNRSMMDTVFAVVQNINTALGAAANSRAA